jgi:hypothetical protein
LRKSKGKGLSRNPEGTRETQVNFFFSLTNLDWVQDVLADHGRRLLQHPIRGHNP